MGAYWYISEGKLDAIPVGRSLRERFSGRVRIGAGPASLEGGLSPKAAASRAEAVKRAEKELRKAGDVAPLPREPVVPGASYFEFDGRAARRVLDETFWAPVVSNRTAVLLVGSSRHAVGARTAAYEDVLSPSADPIGAIRGLIEGRPAEAVDWNSLAYVWAALMTEATEVMDLHALPRVRGIAVYAGLGPTAAGNWPITDAMDFVVVGSPLFVEQIA